MGFMDSVSAFTKGVGQKAKGNYDVLALNAQISGLEKEISRIYSNLGMRYFELFKDSPNEELAEFVQAIKNNMIQIENLRRQADDRKAETSAISLVANKESAPPVVNAPQAPQFSQGTKFCVNCGSPMQADDLFCTVCGTRVAAPDQVPSAETTEMQEESSTNVGNTGLEETN